MKKWAILLALGVFFVGVILFIFFHFQYSENSELTPENPDYFNSFCCAKFDYRSDNGIQSKVITSEIWNLTSFFQSIELKKSDSPFNEDWVFRIIFNWNEIYKGGDEVIVLVGNSHIKIGDTNYYVAIGNFSAILENLYSLFNYFLQ